MLSASGRRVRVSFGDVGAVFRRQIDGVQMPPKYVHEPLQYENLTPKAVDERNEPVEALPEHVDAPPVPVHQPPERESRASAGAQAP